MQPDGTYRYHGGPTGLMDLSGWRSAAHSPLVGSAADGFQISAFTDVVAGEDPPMTTSYRLIEGDRLDGAHDGAFDQTYVYVAGSDMLGTCTGAMTVAVEYPKGVYAYFPVGGRPNHPALLSWTPDDSFRVAGR